MSHQTEKENRKMSQRQILKSSDPKIDPCGTPNEISIQILQCELNSLKPSSKMIIDQFYDK